MYRYMETIPDNYIKKFNGVVNVLTVLYTILFVSYNTIASLFFVDWIERGEMIIAVALVITSVTKFFFIDWSSKKRWLKFNMLIVGYFVIRVLLLVWLKFDYSTLRSIIVECVYLIAISNFLIDREVLKKVIFRLIIYVNLVLNIVNIIIYWLMQNIDLLTNESFVLFLKQYTFLGKENAYEYSAVYSNPNTFGIMTAFALIIALAIRKELGIKLNNILFIIYIAFSVYCIYISQCRSAQVGCIIVIFSWVVTKLFKKVSAQTLAAICLISCIILIFGTYAFTKINIDTGLTNFSASEDTINELSTRRYFIWKSSALSQPNNFVLGVGSQSKEISIRNEYIVQTYGYDQRYDKVNTHNGYLSMLFCSGILGFAFFFVNLLLRIRGVGKKNRGIWNYALIYILIVNLFESAFIVNKLFICLYLFLILAMDEDEDEALDTNEEIKHLSE